MRNNLIVTILCCLPLLIELCLSLIPVVSSFPIDLIVYEGVEDVEPVNQTISVVASLMDYTTGDGKWWAERALSI